MSVAVIEERLRIASKIPLSRGSHPDPGGDVEKCEWCAVEKLLFALGAPWGDRNPDFVSEVLAAFMRSFQDRTNDAGREVVDEWILREGNALRALETAHDGHDEKRRWILVDWSARSVAPLWLDAAGRDEAAASLRAHAPVEDRAGADSVLELLHDAKAGLPDWWTWREKVRVTAREAMAKWLRDHPGALKAQAAGAVGAVAAVAAAAAAEAAGAAGAVGAAEAVGAAGAAAAAGAVGAAEAVGAAGAAAAAGAAEAAEAAAAAEAAEAAEAAAAAEAAEAAEAAAAAEAAEAAEAVGAAEAAGAAGAVGAAEAAEAVEAAEAAAAAGAELRKAARRGFEKEWSKRFAHILEPIQASVPELLDRLVTIGGAAS
jgi:hypothetical protein